jgi:WD40 repeat protein
VRFELVPAVQGAPARARPRGRALAGGAKEAVASAAYSPDGSRLAFGGSKGTVTILDTTNGQSVCETKPLGVEILRVAFSGPGLGLVAASSYDHALRSWPVATCRSEPTRYVGHRALVMALGFTSDDAYLVSVSHDSTIKLWDPRVERDELFSRRMTRPASGRVLGYDFSRLATAPLPSTATSTSTASGSPERTRIATVGAEREEGESTGETLTLWDLAARDRAEYLRGLPSGAQPVDLSAVAERLRLARELRVEPKLLKDQLPVCR